MIVKTNCIPDKSLMSENDKNELWNILCLSNNEFVPPLSSRNSTTQQDFAQNIVQDKPTVYFEELLEQKWLVAKIDNHIVGFLSFIEKDGVKDTVLQLLKNAARLLMYSNLEKYFLFLFNGL